MPKDDPQRSAMSVEVKFAYAPHGLCPNPRQIVVSQGVEYMEHHVCLTRCTPTNTKTCMSATSRAVSMCHSSIETSIEARCFVTIVQNLFSGPMLSPQTTYFRIAHIFRQFVSKSADNSTPQMPKCRLLSLACSSSSSLLCSVGCCRELTLRSRMPSSCCQCVIQSDLKLSVWWWQVFLTKLLNFLVRTLTRFKRTACFDEQVGRVCCCCPIGHHYSWLFCHGAMTPVQT